MTTRVLLTLLIFPIVGFSQAFELKKTNIVELRKDMEQNNSTEIIYSYLLQEYKKVGEKKNIKMFDSNKTKICAFEQEFLGGITYSINECSEEGGMTFKITFPTVGKKTVMNWIEIMDSNDLSEIDNSWNENGTIYRPTDEGVGCYYTIINDDKSTVVEIWCGC